MNDRSSDGEKQFDFLKEKDKLFIVDFTKKLDERQIQKCGGPYLYERGWYRAAAVF